MRRLGYILLLCCCCLVFAGGDRGVALSGYRSVALSGGRSVALSGVGASAVGAEWSTGDAAAAQWRCERMYNSDLNLPRTAGEAFASPFAAPVFPRSCQRDAAHAPLHAAACRSGAASRDEIPFFRLPIRFSGVRPADYYVYRLRRLLI